MKNNLKSQGWFAFYKGFVYRNRPLNIHTAINNKLIIDNGIKAGSVNTVAESVKRFAASGWSEVIS